MPKNDQYLPTVDIIRNMFRNKLKEEDITEERTLELITTPFQANEPTIFGQVNKNYLYSELKWYFSHDTNISALTSKLMPELPKIWQDIIDVGDGKDIDPNYGRMIFHLSITINL